MTTLSSKPMRLFLVEFDELYARHLCRHSQTGINVVHLIALAVIWYAVYGLLYQLIEVEWIVALPALLYVAMLTPNVPLRVLTATGLFLSGIVALAIALPQAPLWANLIAIVAFYKVQAWSHRFYTVSFDITEFDRKYRKGPLLFVVLLLYEVPIVLNFLLFAHATRADERASQRDTAPATAL